jgi:hypothetical protein
MRISLTATVAVLLFATFAFAQKSTEITQTGKPEFHADFPSGGELRMHLRSGDVKISAADQNEIKVHYEGKAAADLSEVKLKFQQTGNIGELQIDGGPRNEFSIEIQVPKDTSLYLRMFAGDVNIDPLRGSKDIEIHAGDMNIAVGNPDDYASVDASVSAGDLSLGPFGVEKSGLFRSFKQQGKGQYKLHVHTGAGDVDLLK